MIKKATIEKDPKKILHIYTRVSTVAQRDKGTSLDTQLALGIKRAKELKLGYKHWDEGGKSSHHEDIKDRPVLSALYDSIVNGEVKHLWVYDQSRLSRNDYVASSFRYICDKNQVTVYTKDGQFDLSNPTDKLLKQMLDALAQFDNAARAERSRLGKISKVKAGYWHGGPAPFGYKIVEKRLIVEPAEAKWVKKIFADSLAGKSTLDVKRLLDSKGVIPRRAKGLWTIGSLQALIKNTHYIGKYEYTDKKSGTVVKVSCPAIVDELTWKSVQQLKTRDISRTSQKNRTKKFYLLRDLMFCGHCGRPFGARSKESKNENLYYCPNKERTWVTEGGTKTPWARGTGCGMARSLNIPETDALVWELVGKIHSKSSLLKEEVKRRILKEQGVGAIRSEAEIKALEIKIKKLQKELSQAEEAHGGLEANFRLGEITKKVYEFGVQRVKEKISVIETELTNTQLELVGNNANKRWVDWVAKFGEELVEIDKLSEEDKKTYLNGLIEKITVMYLPEVNEHQLTVHFQLPIVKDGIRWKDVKNKSKGYALVKGGKEAGVRIKKKDPRWSKSVTPFQNSSVTVE